MAMTSRLTAALRNHRPFLIIAPLLVIVMTFPTLPRVFDTDAFIVPTRNTDVYQKLWDVWHGRQFLAGETGFYHTEAMFYPQGVSLAYENFSLPQMLAVALLSAVLPPASAYSLTYLLIVYAAALSAYIYIYYLFGDRWLATLGAVVFGFSQHVIAHAAHPDVNLIVNLPLSAYFFQRAMREGRLKHLLVCGCIVGLSAFLGLYIFVCALISLALFVLGFALSRWKEARFWRWLPLLCLVITIASAGRILPMLADAEDLTDALDKSADTETGTDLLSYFINYRHPLMTPLLKALFDAGSPFYEPHTSYLGYLPLALILVGLYQRGSRRRMLPWLALALPFLILRLGSVLQIDGEQFSHFVLPKALLDDLIPLLFQPFHTTDHFQMGLLLPLAVMTCYGLKSLLHARPPKQRALITLAVIAVVAFEYYEKPALRVVPEAQFDFINWLSAESGEDEPRLINLPMGRQPAKVYGLYQTMTGFPQVEGLSGRTPPAAYNYINVNYLLAAWREGAGVLCYPPHQSVYLETLEQLARDGFTHVIWHHWLGRDAAIANSFVDADSAYSDDYARIYRLEALRRSCDLPASVAPSTLEHLRGLENAPVIIPRPGSAILSLRSDEEGDQSNGMNDPAALFGMQRYHRLALVDGEVALPSDEQQGAPAVSELLARDSVILLAYDPRTASAQAIASYRGWLAGGFKSCGPLTERDDAVIEFFLRAAYPCELALTADPLDVRYDNGVQLGNLLFEFRNGQLDLFLLWTELPDEGHGVSIQVFDSAGEKAAGGDHSVRSRSLIRQRMDLSSLAPGDYELRLILYHYETRASVAGIVEAGQSRFERALAIGSITVE